MNEPFNEKLSLAICLDHCKYFKFAALGNGKSCICLENFSKIEERTESECNKPCGGDENTCGGAYRWNSYQIENPKALTGQCMQDQG